MFWGICPSSGEPPCPLSYQNGLGLPDWLVGWISRNFFPGAGGSGTPRTGLPTEYRDILQVSTAEVGFCAQCGLHLVFAAKSPELGRCEKCKRQYEEADLSRAFCPSCGLPISIGQELKAEYGKQKGIATLLEQIPTLRQYGFLQEGVALSE